MPAALRIALVVAAAAAARAPGDTRPNILLFFPDTVRAESLSVYGHPLIHTPNTERLAASGVLFSQAHAQHTQCTPSRCALLTGRYMHVLGHRTQNHLLQPSEENAFALLKASGYTTISIGKNDALAPGSFQQTFDYWVEDIGSSKGSNPFAFGEAGYYSMSALPGAAPANSTANGDVLMARLVADLLRAGKVPEPFAIMMTSEGGHPPYGAPEPFHSLYSAAQVRAAAPLRAFQPGLPPHLGPAGITSFRNLTSFDDDFFYSLAAIYLGRLAYTDVQLGTVLDALDASAFKANTAVIFSSDHGDYRWSLHATPPPPSPLHCCPSSQRRLLPSPLPQW